MTADLLTEAETLRSSGRQRLSQTVLNNADICLRRAAYYLDPEIEKWGSEAALTGTAYHAGQEHLYRWRQEIERRGSEICIDAWPMPSERAFATAYALIERSVTEGLEHWGDRFKWNGDPDPSRMVGNAQAMLHAYYAGGHYWPAEYRVLGVEAELDTVLDDTSERFWDAGVIDLALEHRETGAIVLDDHKTAGKPWKKGKESPRATNQPGMYFWLWEHKTGVRPSAFSFSVMTYACKFERRWVYVTDADIALVQTKRRTVVPLLEMARDGFELPGNTSSFLCDSRWCDAWAICPYGGAT